MAKTADELALDILMADVSDVRREEMLRVLYERAQESLNPRCPHCGNKDTYSNVDGSFYLCDACGAQWDAEKPEVDYAPAVNMMLAYIKATGGE